MIDRSETTEQTRWPRLISSSIDGESTVSSWQYSDGHIVVQQERAQAATAFEKGGTHRG